VAENPYKRKKVISKLYFNHQEKEKAVVNSVTQGTGIRGKKT
jgi:hypothetical protein